MRTFKIFLIAAFLSFKCFSATLNVGPGFTYSTISAAVAAASNGGDTILVTNGTYVETINGTTRNNLQFISVGQTNAVLVGQFFVPGSNTFFSGFIINPTNAGPGFRMVTVDANGCTFTNCGFNGTSLIYSNGDSSSAIYAKNVSGLTIVSNWIAGAPNNGIQKGLNLVSCFSSNGYAGGTQVLGNTISNCPNDGIIIHGQWFTVDGNWVLDCIDTNWVGNHPDGIQLNRALVDGMTTVQHCRIRKNVFRNETQNIFLEGRGTATNAPTDTNIFCEDIEIIGNVCYSTTNGLVNGVNMAAIGAGGVKGIIIKGSQNVICVGNTIGPTFGFALLFQADGIPGTNVIVKNNLVYNPIGQFVSMDDASMMKAGEWDYNCYFPSNMANGFGWKTNAAASFAFATSRKAFSDWFSTIGSTGTAQEQGALPFNGGADPLLNSFPTATLQAGSPAIDAGVFIGSPYNSDFFGTTRPQGSGWDLGAFELIQAAPTMGPKTISGSKFRGTSF